MDPGLRRDGEKPLRFAKTKIPFLPSRELNGHVPYVAIIFTIHGGHRDLALLVPSTVPRPFRNRAG
jgi:hypothetical protein